MDPARIPVDPETLVTTLDAGVVIHDASGAIVFSNPAAQRILGLTALQMTGRTSMDPRWSATFDDGSPAPGDQHPAMVALRTGEPVVGVVLRVRRGDDSMVDVQINAQPLRQDHDPARPVDGVLVSFTDISAERAVRDEIEREREHAHAVLAAMTDGLLQLAPDGSVVDANDAFCELVGRPLEELRGLSAPFPWWPPERVPVNLLRFHETLGRQNGTNEYALVRADGTSVPVSVAISDIADRNGRSTGTLATFRDETDTIRGAEALRASEHRYQLLADNVNDVVVVTDGERRIEYVSPSVERVFGVSIEAMTGRPATELIHPDDLHLLPVSTNASDLADHVDAEVRVIRADGSFIWVEIDATLRAPGPGGEFAGRFLVARDVTERHELRETRQRELAGFRALVENSSDLISVVDEVGIISFVSPSVAALLGRDPMALIGTSCLDFIHHDDVELASLSLGNTAGVPGLAEPLEVRLLHANGSYRTFELIANNRLDDPVIGGVVINARDVTDRVHAEIELRLREREVIELAAKREQDRLTDQLHQSQQLESLGRLARGVAHDFNNLIGVIRNYSSALQRHLGPGNSCQDDLDGIAGAVERAAELTQGLLLYGRHDDTTPEGIDVNAVVSDVVDLLAPTVAGNVLVTFDRGPDCRVTMARGRLEQVLVNLILNAAASSVAASRIVVSTAAIGGAAQLSVSDDGLGMSDMVKRRAFEPFFTTDSVSGTGLGLATVLGIVERAGGSIWLDSELGRGTTVRMSLPIQPLREETSPRRKPTATAS